MAPTTSNVQQEQATGNENKYPRTLRAQDEIDLLNTLEMLEGLQRDQERLAAELELAGLTSFVDRSEWLLEHRTEDEKLADARRWARYEAEFLHPRAGEKHSAQPTRACIRCGYVRVVHSRRVSALCGDCKFTMTKAEISLWLDEDVAA